MLRIINYFRGVVRIRIEGAFPERLINICSKNGVEFWGLERQGANALDAYVRISGYKKLRPFAQKAMCHVHILKKDGVRFLLWKVRKRYALLAGFLFCVALVWTASLFVWEIEVVGNEDVPREEILKNLSEFGVEVGTYIPSVDPNVVKIDMMLKMRDIAWIAVNMQGSRALIEVRERVPKPEIIPHNVPCNIVSSKAGVITKIDTLAGLAQVSVGQTVTEGQLLVSGVVDSEAVGVRFVHAMANVECRTWYHLTAVIPQTAIYKKYTEHYQNRTSLSLAQNKINIYFDSGNPYAGYDKIIKSERWSLPFDILLPISVETQSYREFVPEPGSIPESEARSILQEGLTSRLREMSSQAKVEESEFLFSNSGDVYSMTLNAQCLEQIATTELIPTFGARQ